MTEEQRVAKRMKILGPMLDERERRVWAGAEAMTAEGGITAVSRAAQMSRMTIRSGIREIKAGLHKKDQGRVRRPGAGRKRLEATDPGLVVALDALVDPITRGDPESALRWTCKSKGQLAEELTRQGHPVSPTKVGEMLREMDYSLQSTRKTLEGSDHPDRDAQFRYIADRVAKMQRRGQPVISVDTKKKELIGDYKNAGKEWQPKGEPEKVRVHDFIDEDVGKAIPYGVYDIAANSGWVSVGVDHDTADFAVETIRRWWKTMGRRTYPHGTHLLITADAGGSNSSRVRAWKLELQKLADEMAMRISVCHFPPGTSKWNKIEHRMFSHITQNWRGRPLVSHEAVVNLIANTTTRTGLRIKSALDTNDYPTGVKIADDEMAELHLKRDTFHGDWNYTLHPRQ